ncbi:hypothetical protein FSARC_14733 [Fusarium sarcochroum]|uniref:Fungal N-terminal domain-containing protein n=1 Tax=Fusarium sarcochroum TaxID=1208366 RepID=A0A8H4SR66_9HYPO|nr:hypothetical protein FSARC_14733 [Fusarium sarcochroum]
MEVIGGIAAVVQLVQTLGTTIIQVSGAYSQVRDMDDFVRDFDSQLDATRMLLSILGDGISCGSLNPNIQGWWRQSELERLLRSCQQLFNRLHNIFIKIARQRSTVKNLRGWIRLKGYDSDINHLRLSINTCTDALQLPVIIHNIHFSGQARSSEPLKGEVRDLLEELATRMVNLESSIDRAHDDLVMRALQKSQEPSSPTHHLAAIEDMVKELKHEMSTLAASQRTQTPTTSPSETETQLAQIQATLSQLRFGIVHDEEDIQSILEPQEVKEKSDMENETRSMLEFMDGLVSSAKDYVSTIDSMSVSTRRIRRRSNMRADATGRLGLRATFQTSQGFDFPPAELTKDKRRDIVDWVDNVDDEGNLSVDSISSALKLRSEASEGTTVTTKTTQSSNTAVGSNKLLAELRERRIQVVEDLMRTKNYTKVLPHLDRLLASKDEMADVGAEARLCCFMAQALSETTPEDAVMDSYCQRFPLIKSKLYDLRLEHATDALSQKDYPKVRRILRPYKRYFAVESDSASTDGVNVNTLQNIRLVFGQALLKSVSYKDKHEGMSMLEALLEGSSLGPTDRGVVHDYLARAFYLKADYEKAKEHCILACQIKMDAIGRDDEDTQASIALIIDICSETNDSDEAIWRQMLPDPKSTDNPQVTLPRPFSISRYPPDPAVERRMRKARESMGMRWYTPGAIEFLKENYPLRNINCFSYYQDIMCLDCLFLHLNVSQAFVLSRKRRSCRRHRISPIDNYINNGLSLLHYFAMVKPRDNGKSYDSPRPDCISELSILINQAKTTVAQPPDRMPDETPGVIATRSPSPSENQFHYGFLLHELINPQIHYGLGGTESHNRRYIKITPLWGAALSGNLTTVSFFLSLKETDVTAGSRSILLLRRPHPQNKTPVSLLEDSKLRSQVEVQEAESYVFRAVSVAFGALTFERAQYLLCRRITLGEQDPHWCFSNHSLLDQVLQKCGDGSADSLVNDWLLPCPRDDRLSLIDNFLSFISTQSGEGLNEATRKEFTAMLQSLLKHSKTDPNSGLSRHRMTGLIKSIRGAVDLMIKSQPSTRATPRSEQQIMLWVKFIEVLVDDGYMVESDDRLSLQACVDRLTVFDQLLLNLNKMEDMFSNNIKTLEEGIVEAQRLSLLKMIKGLRLTRKKEKMSRDIGELEEKKEALIAKLKTRDELKKIFGKIAVPREESPF